MTQIDKRSYGKDYAENLIDYLLSFNTTQTWNVSSGTGSATLDAAKKFEGINSLNIENTSPSVDLVVTNATQSTTITDVANYNFSLYALKSEVNEFFELEVNIFKNAVLLDTQTLTIGSETSTDDVNDLWVRYMSPIQYAFSKGDDITFTFTLKGKTGTSLVSTELWIDGLMLNKAERLSKIVPNYNKSINTPLDTGTGWAQYGDAQYTSASPLNCPDGVETIIDIDGLGNTIKTQIPTGVTDLYDIATSKILPINSGDGIGLSLSFLAESTTTNSYAELGIDIGFADNIFRRTLTFPRGANVLHPFTFSTLGYELGTFLANGGILKITSGSGTVLMHDITLQIHRLHKAR